MREGRVAAIRGDQFGHRPDGLTLAKVKAAAHGIDLGPLAPRVPEVLRTPSGKIELAPALFLGDLKHVEADLAAPAPDLVVIGRRDLRSNNSWMHNLPVLTKGPRRCTALIHPADSARCGVTDAGPARLIGAGGHAVTVEVKVSDEVMPGVISLPHGWGHDLPGIHLEVAARRPGANLNALLDENLRVLLRIRVYGSPRAQCFVAHRELGAIDPLMDGSPALLGERPFEPLADRIGEKGPQPAAELATAAARKGD